MRTKGFESKLGAATSVRACQESGEGGARFASSQARTWTSHQRIFTLGARV